MNGDLVTGGQVWYRPIHEKIRISTGHLDAAGGGRCDLALGQDGRLLLHR